MVLFGLWCVYFFTGNMNLLIMMTSLLLRNATVDVDVKVEQQNLQLSQEQNWQRDAEEIRFREQWQQYKVEFDKNYQNDFEEYQRMNIFKENSRVIEEHNLLYYRKLSTFELGHNEFSDLTHEEFLEKYTAFDKSVPNFEESVEPTVKYEPTVKHEPTVKYAPTVKYEPTVKDEPTVKYRQQYEPIYSYNIDSFEEGVYEVPLNDNNGLYRYDPEQKVIEDTPNDDYVDYISPANVDLPVYVDWRRQGAVTPVKNQGNCKASWLFSATGALEGQVFRKTHNLTSLSEQNLLDCSNKFGNKGCQNGTVLNSFNYIFKNKGIDSNATYQWRGKQGWTCKYKKYPSNPTVRKVMKIKSGNETLLQAAVATIGPISVGIDARSHKFQFYKNGIYYDPKCTKDHLIHYMLVVGYNRDYWIVKNSLGRNWGKSGYIYLPKSSKNCCGIATRALFPLV